MKVLSQFFILISLALIIGCQADELCEDVECGPGVCDKGICECPDGFSGDNCEIEFCFGVDCFNGDCDPQTQSCNCHTNYYGEGCDILCVNGEFTDGECNCLEGYEGISCETQSRCRFMGWWGCSQWTSTSQIGGMPIPQDQLGNIKIEGGNNINEVILFPTENANGLMLLNTNNIIVGQVTENTINFESQFLSNGNSVHGSVSLDDNMVFSFELFVFNPITSLTQEAKGTFFLVRNIKQ